MAKSSPKRSKVFVSVLEYNFDHARDAASGYFQNVPHIHCKLLVHLGLSSSCEPFLSLSNVFSSGRTPSRLERKDLTAGSLTKERCTNLKSWKSVSFQPTKMVLYVSLSTSCYLRTFSCNRAVSPRGRLLDCAQEAEYFICPFIRQNFGLFDS